VTAQYWPSSYHVNQHTPVPGSPDPDVEPLADSLTDDHDDDSLELDELPDGGWLSEGIEPLAEVLGGALPEPLADGEGLPDTEGEPLPDGDALADAEGLAEGEPLADAEGLTDTDAEGLTDTDAEGLTDTDAEGLTDADAEGLTDAEGEPLGEAERLSDKLSDRLSELDILSETLDQLFAEPQLILPSDQMDTPS